MYLHIGDDMSVPQNEILGIFDMESATVAADTRAYLAAAQKKGRVVNEVDDIPKSFIVCMKSLTTTVYISRLSAKTLAKRAENGFSVSE